jgi:starch synthase
MSKLRILYAASEINPFLQTSEVADFIRSIPQVMQERGMEIRILVPRFGTINERKNRLHEVVRLSGINISVGDEEKPLVIKVASIPNAKLQVYFIDNEDYFHRKSVFVDSDNRFHADNDERAIFFCKGVLETVRKLGWAPDIVHCNDWMTSLIPMYMKTT